MNEIKLLLLISISTIIPGQLIRIPIGASGFLTLTDISVIITVLTFIIYSLLAKKKIYLPKGISFLFSLFTIFALLSLIMALTKLSPIQVVSSSFFLVRFLFYFSIIIVTLNVISAKDVEKWLRALIIIGLSFTFVGLLQLLFLPDLRFLAIYGWDPHINRLVSSLIDPNFTGGLLLIFLCISISMYVFKRSKFYLTSSAIFMISIILTFSRSSYLAFLTVMTTIGVAKSQKVFLISLTAFLVSAVLIPKTQERIVGIVTVDETAKARLESWQNALLIFKDNFLFGVGFNTYRYAQIESGKFSFENPQGGHSGAGVDSSILLIAATTGIVGLTIFTLFLLSILKAAINNVRYDYLKLATLATLLALILHTQFVNSFFFPQIMVIFWLLIGLNFARK